MDYQEDPLDLSNPLWYLQAVHQPLVHLVQRDCQILGFQSQVTPLIQEVPHPEDHQMVALEDLQIQALLQTLEGLQRAVHPYRKVAVSLGCLVYLLPLRSPVKTPPVSWARST